MSKLLVTPVEAYPIIKGYAVNKSFCDLGSGNNKLCYAMRDIVTQCIGISWVGDENTISGDFTGFLPKAEVYYMWVGCPEFCYEKIKDRLNGILLVGAHHGTREFGFIYNNLENIEAVYTVRFLDKNGQYDYFSIGVFNHVQKA